MQEIGGELNHLAVVAVADKNIITILTKKFESLTQNNVSLTAQLRYAMKLNPKMDKKLNLKQKNNQKK